jgi:hypothetical protein
MKNLFVLICAATALASCSSSSGGGGGGGDQPPNTPFEKSTNGEWLSECTQAQGQGIASYKEHLILKTGGSGTRSYDIYNSQDCSGAKVKTSEPSSLKYTVANAATADGQPVKVTIQAPGQDPVEVTVITQGEDMQITSPTGTVKYHRVSGGGNTPVGNTSFEKAALGTWVTQNCYQYQNGATAKIVITFSPGSKAASVVNVYRDAQCGGEPTAEQHQDFTYKVDNYANGGGQITINGGQAIDVSFQGNTMTMTSGTDSKVYVKVR